MAENGPENARTPPKRVVYTCVTNDYDRIIPPVDPMPGVAHILFTDRPETTQVAGWTTRAIDLPDDLSPSLCNRYYKILTHRVLPDFDQSLYLDANIAIIGSLDPFFDEAFGGPEPMALYEHPVRNSVAAEAQAVAASGRSKAPEKIEGEISQYRAQGFPDTDGLTSNAILARHHTAPDVVAAMELWWDLMQDGSGRDQLSLPFVRWKQDLPVRVLSPDFSYGSPYFLRYPHWASSGKRGRALLWAAQRKQGNPFWGMIHDLLVKSYGSNAPHF